MIGEALDRWGAVSSKTNKSYCIAIFWSGCLSFVSIEIKAGLQFVISGFHRDVNENCTFPGYYAAYSGNSLPTFRDNLSVPSSRVWKSKKVSRNSRIWIYLFLKTGPIVCPDTSVRNCHSTLCNIPEERSFQIFG